MPGAEDFRRIVGRTVSAIFMGEEYLAFRVASDEFVTYTVEGDCCSWSYFHDLTGVEKLLEAGQVTDIQPVDDAELPDDTEVDSYEVTAYYGYKLTSDHPKWGLVTTVIGFRNESNGYYGGWMEYSGDTLPDGLAAVTADVQGD